MCLGPFSGIVTPPLKVIGSKELDSDSPGGLVVNNPPHPQPSAEDTGLIPALEKVSCALEQLSVCAPGTEALTPSSL